MASAPVTAWEERARELDAADPLAPLRERFTMPQRSGGGDVVYLCGHSLGLQPRAAGAAVQQVMDEWGRMGVRGHQEAAIPWYAYHEALGPQAAALVGAKPSEVVSMNSLTVNLHLMLVSFYRPDRRRRKIAIEAAAFPSDRYAVESQMRFHGVDVNRDLLILEPRPGEEVLRTEDVESCLRQHAGSLALVLLGGVQYLTGQCFDMVRIAAAGRAAGAVVGFDLAHAVGNVPLELHAWDVDFAVWCSYKYLNGGPGAPGGCFVHERHAHSVDLPRFEGWWGTDPALRFRMEPVFHPQPGAAAWQLSNPPILAMAALRASLDLFHTVGMPALRRKSQALTGFLAAMLVDAAATPPQVITPADPAQRGCQLSLRVGRQAGDLVRELGRRGVNCDARDPDVLRVAPVPLYNTFSDVATFVRHLRELLAGR